MSLKGTRLASNLGTTAPTSPQFFSGGRAAVVVVGTTFPTTCQLQLKGQDDATYINVGSNISANGVTALDLPAGQYRLNLVTGTTAGLYVDLVSIPYI